MVIPPGRSTFSARIILLLGCATVAYTYLGYPVLVRFAARRRRAVEPPPPAWAQGGPPPMTAVVPALNEADVIADKLGDLRRQGVPADRLDVVVVADGSRDRTADIARSCGARVLHDGEPRGKSDAVNRGVAAARHPVVVVTDANSALSPGALATLAAGLDRPGIAVVGGVKAVVGAGARGGGEGMYWRIESAVMAAEAALGAPMGVPGELYALRRAQFRRIPRGVLNDDYHVTCDALIRGLGVSYAATARATEVVSTTIRDELERRTRIAAGTWQTTLAHLPLGDPRRGWVAVAFVSHRLLRSVVTPVLLPLLLAASAALAPRDRLARLLLHGQLVWYALGLLGFVTDHRAVAAPYQFLLANVATLRGAARLLLRRQPVVWRRASRGPWTGGGGEGG